MSEPVGQEEATPEGEAPSKSKRKTIILLAGALVLGLAAGGGVMVSGVLSPKPVANDAAGPSLQTMQDVQIVPMEQILVSTVVAEKQASIRLVVNIETPTAHLEQTKKMLPRIADVFNGYIRAVDPGMLAEPQAFERTRAALLRRARLVAGDQLVRDVLIQELLVL